MSELIDTLNRETARISWRELQPFFARGQTVAVDPDLDLVAVAAAFADDDKPAVQGWMDQARVAVVTDAQSAAWLDAEADMWAVVVAPFVLVQPVA